MKLGLRNIVNIGELTQQVDIETQHSVRHKLPHAWSEAHMQQQPPCSWQGSKQVMCMARAGEHCQF